MIKLKDLIRENNKSPFLYIIRGLPGSGKSTKANELKHQGKIDDYFEADMFFEKDGIYNYDPSKIKYAHAWCKNETIKALSQGKSVAVSNTFTRKWEYQDYIDYAIQNNIPFEIITCTGNYQNVHGVPDEVIKKMRDRFEPTEN